MADTGSQPVEPRTRKLQVDVVARLHLRGMRLHRRGPDPQGFLIRNVHEDAAQIEREQRIAAEQERDRRLQPLPQSDNQEEAIAVQVTPDYVLMTRKASDQEHAMWRKRERAAFEAGIVHVLQRKMEDDRYARAWLGTQKAEVDEAFAAYRARQEHTPE